MTRRYNIDVLLYSLIQRYATFNPNEENENHRLYLTEQDYTKHIKEIKRFCDIADTRTLNNHLNKLIEDGILEKFILIIDGAEYPSYGIIVNKDIPYQTIDNDWLFYLISTRSRIAIKIYFILLDWFEDKNNYEFSQKKIAAELGYREYSDDVIKMVGNVLRSLKREGIINYDELITPHFKLKLTYVARSEHDCQKNKEKTAGYVK